MLPAPKNKRRNLSPAMQRAQAGNGVSGLRCFWVSEGTVWDLVFVRREL
jgi:hypothetical protein